VTLAGRAFQTGAPATEKARRPTVGSLTAGTNRSSEVEDRSLCHVGMSATGVNCRSTEGHYRKVPGKSVGCNLKQSFRALVARTEAVIKFYSHS